MNKLFDKIINLISPKGIKCIICDDELDRDSEHCICHKCFDKLPFVTKACSRCGGQVFSRATVCVDCKAEPRCFKRAIAPFNFSDEVSSLVYRLKYGEQTYLAQYLAFFMTNKLVECGIVDFDAIIPVPLSDKRLKLRTFNQAQLLAQEIATNLNKPILVDCLVRDKDTLTQTHLSKQQRVENLKDAFRVVDKSKIKGKKILLVDDIFTTGATSDEIARVLTRAGSNDIYVVTFAHAINKQEQLKAENTTNFDQK